MKTFIQWCEENKLELDENTKRTGLTANYPELYVRGQYPKGYWPAHKATAFLDLQQKAKTPSNDVP